MSEKERKAERARISLLQEGDNISIAVEGTSKDLCWLLCNASKRAFGFKAVVLNAAKFMIENEDSFSEDDDDEEDDGKNDMDATLKNLFDSLPDDAKEWLKKRF